MSQKNRFRKNLQIIAPNKNLFVRSVLRTRYLKGNMLLTDTEQPIVIITTNSYEYQAKIDPCLLLI